MKLVRCGAGQTILPDLRRRRLRHRLRRGHASGPLCRLRHRARPGRPTPGAGVEIEVIFVGQKMPYEILGPATVAVPGLPAGAYDLWRTWGRLSWEEVAQARTGGVITTPCFPGDPRPVAAEGRRGDAGVSATATWSTAVPSGSYLQAGDPLRHPASSSRFRAVHQRPELVLPTARTRTRWCARWPTAALSASPIWTPTRSSSRRRARSRSTDSPCTRAVMISMTCSAPWPRSPRRAKRSADRSGVGRPGQGAPSPGPATRRRTSWRWTTRATAAKSPPASAWAPGCGSRATGCTNSMIGEGELIVAWSSPGCGRVR